MATEGLGMTVHYEFDISRATRPGDLHALREDISTDGNLASEEKEALLEIISAKFGEWNRRAAGVPKPR